MAEKKAVKKVVTTAGMKDERRAEHWVAVRD